MVIVRPHGLIVSFLVIAGVSGCAPSKGGTESDSATASSGDTTAAATDSASVTGASASTAATGTDSGTTDPGPVTSDGCAGGCSRAPICGEPCNCCCGCSPGESSCEQIDGAAAVFRCAEDGSCFEPERCAEGERCTVDAGGSASCSGAAGTCEDIEAEYDAIVEDPANKGCADVAECKVISGDCGVGLGGCHYAVAQKFDETPLDVLAMQYSDMGCTSAVCDCAAPPPLVCVDGLCGFEP